MCENMKKVLINKMRFNCNERIETINSFDSYNHLMHFCIDSHLNYDENKAIPRLVLPQKKTRLGLNLEEGFNESVVKQKLITNYEKYRNEKWIHFLNCLNNNQIISEEKPHFVSFGGLISDSLCAIYQNLPQNDSFFALLFRGVIYLYKFKNLEVNEEMNLNVSKYSYFGLKFVHLITNRDMNNMNEFEKHFNVDKLELNEHKLIVLNEIDAINEKEELFDAKARQVVKTVRSQENFYRKKLLKDWSQCIIRGVKTIIFGNRDENILKDIGEEDVEDIPERCIAYWSHVKCFTFTDRLLQFIKSSVEEELTLYEFTYEYSNRCVSCHSYLSDGKNQYFLPNFYTQ